MAKDPLITRESYRRFNEEKERKRRRPLTEEERKKRQARRKRQLIRQQREGDSRQTNHPDTVRLTVNDYLNWGIFLCLLGIILLTVIALYF